MTNIQWTQNEDGSEGKTWNPTVGCMKVSEGCTRCYAITTAYRIEHAFKQDAYAGLTRKLPDGSVNWTGKVRTLPERLGLPLTWKKPQRVFVDSMSDLWHEDVPDEFIDQVFAAMATAHWHTFQVLTKRPQRMLAWFKERYQVPLIDGSIGWEARDDRVWSHRGDVLDPAKDAGWTAEGEVAAPWSWPLPNVWLGVSVEDQRAADERIPLLLQTPAVVRFLSCEPLLGPVDLHPGKWIRPIGGGPRVNLFRPWETLGPTIDWVIAGGESGSHARLMQREWATSLRDQCVAASVPFFFKQHGGRTHNAGGRELDGRTWDEFPDSKTREVALT